MPAVTLPARSARLHTGSLQTASPATSCTPRADVPAAEPPRHAALLMLAVVALIATGAFVLGNVDRVPAGPVTAPTAAPGTLAAVADQLDVRAAWSLGLTGSGVNVAVVDTGVASVPALAGNLVVRADLTADAVDPTVAGIDLYGHGTHLAGIIAGNDDTSGFRGLAPDAGIVSVKVAGRDGSVNSNDLIAGIDWVVAHRDEYDVRVLTLAFNADDVTPAVERELLAAVERAADAGLVVVGAAGNDPDAAGLVPPATSPSMIAVASVDAADAGFVTSDFSSRGDGLRNPDLAAPGAHVQSLRAPGSQADREHPEGYVDETRFLASGTSQSAAEVAALAALTLQADPNLTNDQVRSLLVESAAPVGTPVETGAGVPSMARILTLLGDAHAASADTPAGVPWSGQTWSGQTWSGQTWSGQTWS